MSITVKFGQRLKSLRLEKKMSQEDLAASSKLSVYYISKLERGQANPSLETISKISKALSINLSDLLAKL